MAHKDQIKWDKKYQETTTLLEERDPSIKLQKLIEKNHFKQALDVACGAGKNSIYMAKQGIMVDAIDISQIALKHLDNKNIENISTQQVDLDEYKPLPNHYDLIVKTNFLDRQLIPKLIKAIKTEGHIYIETYMHDEINEKPPSNPDFLLQKEELKEFFQEGFTIIEYDEFENAPEELYRMKKQSIIAKKL